MKKFRIERINGRIKVNGRTYKEANKSERYMFNAYFKAIKHNFEPDISIEKLSPVNLGFWTICKN